MAQIQIPTPLRKFTDNKAVIELEGSTVLSLLRSLIDEHPSLKPYLLDGDTVRPYIRLFKGDTDIQSLDKEQTVVSNGETLSIIPAIAGGKL